MEVESILTRSSQISGNTADLLNSDVSEVHENKDYKKQEEERLEKKFENEDKRLEELAETQVNITQIDEKLHDEPVPSKAEKTKCGCC